MSIVQNGPELGGSQHTYATSSEEYGKLGMRAMRIDMLGQQPVECTVALTGTKGAYELLGLARHVATEPLGDSSQTVIGNEHIVVGVWGKEGPSGQPGDSDVAVAS